MIETGITASAPAEDRLTNTLEYLERLNGGAASRISWQNLRDSFDMLTDQFPLIVTEIRDQAAFGRARIWIAAQKPKSLSEIGPPPIGMSRSFGRCNRPGAPFLYGGVGTQLCLSEIGAEIGDSVLVVHFRPKRPLYVVRLGAIDLYRRTDGNCALDDQTKEQIKQQLDMSRAGVWQSLIDAALADYFSRPGSRNVYKITSAMTSALIDGNRKIDGILYESVDHREGACLALKPHCFSDLEPFAAQMIDVTSYLGYGIFDINETAFAEKFSSGSIVWP